MTQNVETVDNWSSMPIVKTLLMILLVSPFVPFILALEGILWVSERVKAWADHIYEVTK